MEETMMMSRSTNGSKPRDHHEIIRAAGKPATTLSLREDSHSISKPKSKPKPKIRIVHIFAPEIIKTDASNFRELVQRLTGKPSARTGNKRMKMSQMMKREFGEEEEEEEEEERGMLEESSGGYLSNLGEFEGFFQGFANDYSNSIYASIDI